jgi:hypothetical protein
MKGQAKNFGFFCLKRPTGNGRFHWLHKGYSQFSGLTNSTFETDALIQM